MSILNYQLPKGSIAKYPANPRDHSKLLVVDQHNDNNNYHFVTKNFYDLTDLLEPNDILIVNNSKVIAARLLGRRVRGENSAKIEVLLMSHKKGSIWNVLLRPKKKVQLGDNIFFADDFRAVITKINQTTYNDYVEIDLLSDLKEVYEKINKYGKIPIPPYISKEVRESDTQNYQTCYAKEIGSVAAPTAGLHFTNQLLEKIKAKNVKILEITLSVGGGTFLPLTVETIKSGRLHSENYKLPKEVLDLLYIRYKSKFDSNLNNNLTKQNGRIIVVGTTTLRTLETCMQKIASNQVIKANVWYQTDLMIDDKHKFMSSDALITNFHLPNTSLLLLVSSFAGKDCVLDAYNFAINNNYRFYSYGDASFFPLSLKNKA